MRRNLIAVIFSVLFLTSISPALGAKVIQVTGQITNFEGRPVPISLVTVIYDVATSNTTETDALGRYSISVNAGVGISLWFRVDAPENDSDESGTSNHPIRQSPFASEWRLSVPSGFTENTTLNLQLPKPLKLILSVKDAASKQVDNTTLGQLGGKGSYHYGNLNFTFSTHGDGARLFSTDGKYQLYYYPSSQVSLSYCEEFNAQGLNHDFCSKLRHVTPMFTVQADASYQLCLPLNTWDSNTSSTCIDSIINAIDTKAPDKAAAAKKPLTISCVKGRVVKKVTGITPKCPSGYTKKK